MADCSQNSDPLKLVREGTRQDSRSPPALAPSSVPVDERGVAHGIVFARNYAALLKYFNEGGAEAGTWAPFFSNDVSVLLATAAIEDVESYKRSIKAWFDYLNDRENETRESQLRDHLGYLFGAVASLARQLDNLLQALPVDVALQGALRNLVQAQLAPAFRRLIAYYKGGLAATPPLIHVVAPEVRILREAAVTFDSVLNPGPKPTLSGDWSNGVAWPGYEAGVSADDSIFGESGGTFARINHASTHTLFKSVFDQFLKVFARVAAAARQELEHTLRSRDSHEPHYALFLAFLRLQEHARDAGNGLTQRHLDFYYRDILGLQEKKAAPGHVHLVAELARQAPSYAFVPGAKFKAGKDALGKEAFFANRSDFVANQSKVTSLRTLYRHTDEPVAGSTAWQGRFFASPVANSDGGLGAPLTTTDGSWHPFFNKVYTDGVLTEIRMPRAEIGFAVASHYLLMGEGTRFVFMKLKGGGVGKADLTLTGSVRLRLTTEKGWLEVPGDACWFARSGKDVDVVFMLTGAQPAIVPYSAKVHGYTFGTTLPMLLVTLNQDVTSADAYQPLEHATVESVSMTTLIWDMKAVSVSNDFGPIDISKPFQPFGASPLTGSSLVLGSKEIFQKKLAAVSIYWNWMTTPVAYPPARDGNAAAPLPTVARDVLNGGKWVEPAGPIAWPDRVATLGDEDFHFLKDLENTTLDAPDFTANEPFGAKSREGFVRLRLKGDLGQAQYQADLNAFLAPESGLPFPGPPPTGPIASEMTVAYLTSEFVLPLSTAATAAAGLDFERRPGQFFHVTPFGTAEQHEHLQEKGGPVRLWPHFAFTRDTAALQSEAELYIGITGLVPPQNLSLLFQVSDGTANPLAPKPRPHVAWSYLKHDEWIGFARSEVQDGTDELLNSGIVTLAVPRDATQDHTLLPAGQYWIRAAVHERSDAVCRLQLVAAQALEAVFEDQGNAPSFSATPLPAGTISKLAVPDAAVKGVAQRFPSFGGRGAESSAAFYQRVAERLRHKNRACELWDYERLVLEAFPQVYQVKCLNHTRFEPSDSGAGIYRELAPGHVTLITIPNLQARNRRDPLKPYTSLGLLEEIKAFLARRTSCFARLHVRNPQFEEVRVEFSLRLREGYDETYYSNLLRQAITGFLSPWAFAEGGRPSFGGRVYKSVLINFVEEQPYVDYVTDFRVFRDIPGEAGSADLDEVQGSRAVSILVSAPASKHAITVLDPAQDTPLSESCGCEA